MTGTWWRVSVAAMVGATRCCLHYRLTEERCEDPHRQLWSWSFQPIKTSPGAMCAPLPRLVVALSGCPAPLMSPPVAKLFRQTPPQGPQAASQRAGTAEFGR